MSEEMTTPIASPAASVLPWPFSVVWLGDHLSRDYARFWSRLAGASDPVEAAQAEANLGFNLFHDWSTAMGEMWLLPLKVWAASAAPVTTTETPS
ncbi:hypothetical protein [Phenylobacterium sp.]|uniref:hypothetical protein n=1 Tax=Phenylobacterium sp. TaxID=1871053 RepID=UPI00289C5CBA|nr:hypothetical protein [Phenylobacterium sp.]